MGKLLKKLALASSLLLTPFVAVSQEDESINYLPSTMETLVNNDNGQGIGLTRLEKSERRARLANSIFLYEGYDSFYPTGVGGKSFLDRYYYNFGRELKEVNSFRFFDNEDYTIPEDLRAFPYEREGYSALGRTLVEKYKLARDIDYNIKKLRNATTLSVESKSGVKYRIGPFIGESELGAVGVFLKMKVGRGFNMAITGCQNEFEAYVEKKFSKFSLRGGYTYETGFNDNEKEREFYFSLQSKRF